MPLYFIFVFLWLTTITIASRFQRSVCVNGSWESSINGIYEFHSTISYPNGSIYFCSECDINGVYLYPYILDSGVFTWRISTDYEYCGAWHACCLGNNRPPNYQFTLEECNHRWQSYAPNFWHIDNALTVAFCPISTITTTQVITTAETTVLHPQSSTIGSIYTSIFRRASHSTSTQSSASTASTTSTISVTSTSSAISVTFTSDRALYIVHTHIYSYNHHLIYVLLLLAILMMCGCIALIYIYILCVIDKYRNDRNDRNVLHFADDIDVEMKPVLDSQMKHKDADDQKRGEEEGNTSRSRYRLFDLSLSTAKDAFINRRKHANILEFQHWLENQVLLPQYFDVFVSNGYESMMIIKEIMDGTELVDIGIESDEHRMRILTEIEKWKELYLHKYEENRKGEWSDFNVT